MSEPEDNKEASKPLRELSPRKRTAIATLFGIGIFALGFAPNCDWLLGGRHLDSHHCAMFLGLEKRKILVANASSCKATQDFLEYNSNWIIAPMHHILHRISIFVGYTNIVIYDQRVLHTGL